MYLGSEDTLLFPPYSFTYTYRQWTQCVYVHVCVGGLCVCGFFLFGFRYLLPTDTPTHSSPYPSSLISTLDVSSEETDVKNYVKTEILVYKKYRVFIYLIYFVRVGL